MLRAGVNVPMRFEKAEDIDRPVIVKYHGAKGGRGFFIAKTKEELQAKMSTQEGTQFRSSYWAPDITFTSSTRP